MSCRSAGAADLAPTGEECLKLSKMSLAIAPAARSRVTRLAGGASNSLTARLSTHGGASIVAAFAPICLKVLYQPISAEHLEQPLARCASRLRSAAPDSRPSTKSTNCSKSAQFISFRFPILSLQPD